ncbi:MAG: hypothetical protein WCG77_05425 [Actinomycetes bacterium]
MSNRADLIIVSASRTALSAEFSESSRRECPEPCVRLSLADVDTHAVVARAATRGLGSLIVGPDPIPADVWSVLPGIRELSLLLAAGDAASAGSTVVIDAGTTSDAVRLVSLPSVVLRIVDALLTPDVAMIRTGRGENGFEALSELRASLARVTRLLHSPSTVARVAMDVDDNMVAELMTVTAAFAAHGVGLDAVVVVRRTGERDIADAIVERVKKSGVRVWATGRRRRPCPTGTQVNEVLSRTRALTESELDVIHDGDHYVLVVPLAADRVGIDGQDLVIDVAGTLRWVPLPAALRRCTAVRGRRWRGTVEITFAPDAERWRTAS